MTGTCAPGVPRYSILGYERWDQEIPNIEHRAFKMGHGRRGGGEWRSEKQHRPKKLQWPETATTHLIEGSAAKPSAMVGSGGNHIRRAIVLRGFGPKGPRETRSAANARAQSVINPTPQEHPVQYTHRQFHYHVSVGIYVGRVQNAEKEQTYLRTDPSACREQVRENDSVE